MTTYLFPGQGSQALGMGQTLFQQFPSLADQASEILGYSITELCLQDPKQQLNDTQFTQPALFVVSALSFLSKAENSPTPHFLAGHSLGEYNALFASQVFDFATGLKLVQKRGELMSQAQGGGMAAVVGIKPQEITRLLEENGLNQVSIANYNSNLQIVISGAKSKVEAAEPIFKQAGAKLFIPLKVSGAFHSPFMADAKAQFESFLTSFNFTPASIPVIANVNAKPYVADKIKETLAAQITHSVRWTDTIHYLLEQGETEFEEIGPGNVLSGLVKRIQKGQ